MLSQSFARTARTSCAHNSSPLVTGASRHAPATPQIAAAGSFARPSSGRGHQRRPSSSSASSPPNGQRPPASSSEEQASIARDKENRKLRLLRRKLREANDTILTKAADNAAAKEQAFANVPAVPSTGHLQLADVKVSSFFALHRPISINSTFPPSSPDSSSFESIFQQPKHRPNDVIYTISNTAAALESRANSSTSSNDLNWQTVQQDGTTTHLDPVSPQSLEQMIKNFRPFNPPPPPVSFEQRQSSAQKDGQQGQVTHDRLDEYRHRQLTVKLDTSAATSRSQDLQESPHKQRRRTFTTTLSIHETTHADGRKTYSSTAGPVVEQLPESDSPSVRWSRKKLAVARMGLEERMKIEDKVLGEKQEIGEKERREMLLISVKRQRKLKMKKHKYKKLMRKTRNLRIREGRN